MGVAVSGVEVMVCDQNNRRIQVFGLDGSFVRQWGTDYATGQLKDLPKGVAVSDDGQVVVIYRSRVQIFS